MWSAATLIMTSESGDQNFVSGTHRLSVDPRQAHENALAGRGMIPLPCLAAPKP
jgi:hypothetical protein